MGVHVSVCMCMCRCVRVCSAILNPAFHFFMQGLKRFLANALKEADTRQYQSMAVPAIGTGNLGYPHDVVIKLLVNEIVSFSAANPNTTLKDIYVVLFPGDQTTMKAGNP